MPELQTVRLERLTAMKKFGFGPEVMKENKVCRICNHTCSANEKHCSACGAVLPRETIFDLYKAQHLYCPACDTVVSDSTIFCPECGKRLRPRHFGFWGIRRKRDVSDDTKNRSD